MQDTITRYLQGTPGATKRKWLQQILNPIADRMSSQALSTATLAIKAGSSPTVMTTAVYHGIVKGVPVTIASSVDMPALTGTITAAAFNVYCFFIDSASVVTVVQGVEGAAIGNIKWPPFPENKALVGFIIVTHSGTFTGGSTALDTATTVYVSPVGPFDPSILIN